MKLLGKGNAAEVYDYGNNKVLKLFFPHYKPSAVEGKRNINETLHNLNLAPKFFGQITTNGRIGFIYEYIHGKSMLEEITQKPWKIISYAKVVAEIHLTIHKHHISGIPSQQEMLITNINKTELLTKAEKQKIINHLKTLKEKDFLCHGDLHPKNILREHSQIRSSNDIVRR